MDMFATSAQHMVNRLLDHIYEYENKYGEPPKFIIVTARAYWLVENYAKCFFVKKENSGPAPYFKGIEVRICSGNGYDMFLAGEPITLR